MSALHSRAMGTGSQRAAMLEYLEAYTELRRIEIQIRRRERLLVALGAVVVTLNAVAAADEGASALGALCLLIAVWFALNVRRIILDAIERRADWKVFDDAATHARRRLAIEASERRAA